MPESAAGIVALLQAFIDSPSGLAIKALLFGTILVFVLGVWAAKRDGTYDVKYIDTFVRSTVWGRVAPVATVLLVAYVSGDQTILAAAVVVAGSVGYGMIRSALESIQQLTDPPARSAERNYLPT